VPGNQGDGTRQALSINLGLQHFGHSLCALRTQTDRLR
jgi:hypothetical protein